MEETTLSSDLAQGFALKALTGIKKKTELQQIVKKSQKDLVKTLYSSYCMVGFCLVTELVSLFVEQDVIKHYYKNKLVGYVLNGYLSLRKLVVQRTKLIDDSQDKLLELLEELTTGNARCHSISLKKGVNLHAFVHVWHEAPL